MESFATKRSTKSTKSTKSTSVQNSSYGLPFGGFTFGSGILMKCDANDTSFFCKFSRIFQIIMMVVFLLILGVIIYSIFARKNNYFGGAFAKVVKSIHR